MLVIYLDCKEPKPTKVDTSPCDIACCKGTTKDRPVLLGPKLIHACSDLALILSASKNYVGLNPCILFIGYWSIHSHSIGNDKIETCVILF